jgi:hypothetical protein
MRPVSYGICYQGEPKINSVEVHSQLSNNRHPVDGAVVGAGSLWPKNIEFLDSDLFIYLSIYCAENSNWQ